MRTLPDGSTEVELVIGSTKAIAEFLTELNKGTTPLNKYVTSPNPRLDFPPFIIGYIKRSIMSQKYGRLETANMQAPGQGQGNFRPPGNNGYGRFAPPQQVYAQMMGQGGYGYPQPPAFNQYHPYMPYPPQQFQPGPGNYRGQNQYARSGQPGPGFQQPGVVQFPGLVPAPQPQPSSLINTVEDLKASKPAFNALRPEEKQQVYRRLILQKIREIPEIVRQLDNQR